MLAKGKLIKHIKKKKKKVIIITDIHHFFNPNFKKIARITAIKNENINSLDPVEKPARTKTKHTTTLKSLTKKFFDVKK